MARPALPPPREDGERARGGTERYRHAERGIDRRGLRIESVDNLVVVYPAGRDVVGPDAFADLTTTALQIVDGVLAASKPLTPRGIDAKRPE